MLSFFKSIRPAVVAVVVLLSAWIAAFPTIMSDTIGPSPGAFGFGVWLDSSWLVAFPIMGFFLRFALLLIASLTLNAAGVRVGLYQRSNFFVAFFFVVGAAYYPLGMVRWEVIVAVFFLSTGYRHWILYTHSLAQRNHLLNAIFLWVMAGMFYWPMFLMAGSLPLLMIMASVDDWRAYFLPLVVVVFVFLAVLPWVLLDFIPPNVYTIDRFQWPDSNPFRWIFQSWKMAVMVLYSVVLILFSQVELSQNMVRKKVANRRVFRVNNGLMVVLLGVWALAPEGEGEAGLLMAVPSSLLLANTFYYLPERLIWKILFLLTLILPFFLTHII